jgi:molybdenum cofactor guanylyltransferase
MKKESKLTEVAAVILAGGKGRRMGLAKATIKLGGRPLVEHVALLAKRVFERVYVSGPSELEFLGLPVVPDQEPGQGPLAGVLSGLKAAGTPWVFVLPCDSPFIPEAFLWGMASLVNDHEVVVARSGGFYEPLHALYSRRLLPAMEQLISSGERKITSLYERARVKEATPDKLREWDPEAMAFFNINTPEELVRAEAYLKGQGFNS